VATDSDAFILYDGTATSHTYSGGTSPTTLNFTDAVSFSKISLNSGGTGTVEYLDNGKWLPVKQSNGSTTFASGPITVALDKTYTTTKIRHTAGGQALYEFRVGNGGPSLRPALLVPPMRQAQADNTFISYQDVNDLSPYSSRVSLLETPTTQGTVQLVVTKDSVKVATRPTSDQTVKIVAVSEDGARQTFTMTILADAGQDPTKVLPSSVTSPHGWNKIVSTDSDAFILYDGTATSHTYSSGTSPTTLNFTNPVSFSKIALNSGGVGTVEYLDNGVWLPVKLANGTTTFANGPITATLDRTYTTTKVRHTAGGQALYEFRVGGGDPSARPTPLVPLLRPLQADGTFVTFEDFADPSPYSSRVSLLETLTTQGNVQLVVTKDSVKLASRPTSDQTITIVAVSEDGARQSFTMTILADTGQDPTKVIPSSVTSPHGWNRVVATDTDAFILYDGTATSHTYSGSNPTTLIFTQPVSFSKISLNSGGTGTVEYLDNGKWLPVKQSSGSATFAAGPITVTLDRTYTTTQIRHAASGQALYEFRIGGGDPSQRPTLLAQQYHALKADNTYVTFEDFADPSPYSSRVSLASTATTQGSVQLVVTKDSVKLASRPTSDQTITIVAISEDGARQSFTMIATPDSAADAAITPPTSVTSPNGWSKNPTSDTDVYVLYDGTATSFTYSNSNNPTTLNFGQPVSFSKIILNSAGTGTIEYLDNGVWLPVKQSNGSSTYSNGLITATLDRTYTTTKVRHAAGGQAFYEFRVSGLPLTR
jgi:acetaldehyde dehydrogenase (acetylating)